MTRGLGNGVNVSGRSASASPSARPAPATSGKAPRCPRCGGELRFPETLAACIVCGYSREDRDARPTTGQERSNTSRPELLDLMATLRRLPEWAWVLLIGCMVIVAGSVVVGFVLPKESFRRALWTTLQCGAGALAIVIGEVWAFFLLVRGTERFGPLDLIYSLRLWSAIFRHLPRTRTPLCLGAWGLTTILSASILIGGISYLLPTKPYRMKAKGGDVIAGDQGALDGDDDGEVAEIPNDDGRGIDEDEGGSSRDKRATVRCVIIGYTLAENGKLSGLVLATESDEGLRYGGLVKQGLSAKRSAKLLTELVPLVQPKSAIGNLEVQAIWVKPTLQCEIHQSGVAASGLLIDPALKTWIKPAKKNAATKP